MSHAPNTIHDMMRAGYVRLGDATCKGCNAPIAWFTTTNKAKLPVNLPIADDNTIVTPHWATCPKRDEFKGKTARLHHTAAERTRLLQTLLESTGAKAIVAIYPEGAVNVWISKLDPEDIRNDLITAANQVRFQLRLQAGQGEG